MEDKKGLDPASLYYAVTSSAFSDVRLCRQPRGGKNTFGVFCGFEKISKPQVPLGSNIKKQPTYF